MKVLRLSSEEVCVPQGCVLASDSVAEAIEREREIVRKKLVEKEAIPVSRDGTVSKNGEKQTAVIPPNNTLAMREPLGNTDAHSMCRVSVKVNLQGVTVMSLEERCVPQGCVLASDSVAEAIKKEREMVRKKLVEKEAIPVSSGGAVSKNGEKQTAVIPPDTTLASAGGVAPLLMESYLVDTDVHNIRKAHVKEHLQAMEEVMSLEGGSSIPSDCTLAAQWYEAHPCLLELEKKTMKERGFGSFQLRSFADGRLYWDGYLSPGIMSSKPKWRVWAVYQNNHPAQEMGTSVHVHLVEPTIEELIQMAGFRPSHLLYSNTDGYYLCTAEAKDCRLDDFKVSATSSLLFATKWLIAMELVLCGSMTVQEFNAHGGI